MNETEDQTGSTNVTGHSDEAHGHDGHEGASELLGPFDVRSWAFAVAGGAVGLLVALALFAATA